MALSKKDLEAIAGMIATATGQESGDDAPQEAKPRKQSTRKTEQLTRAKARGMIEGTANLDPERLTLDGREVHIVASGREGVFREARVRPSVGKSLTRSDVEALLANADEVMDALQEVERRAYIGEHEPSRDPADYTE